MKRTLWVLVCVTVLFAAPARAQLSPGNSCSTNGQVSLSNTNATYLLVCNGTTWVLGETFPTSGYVGIGTTSPGVLLGTGSSGGTAGTATLESSGAVLTVGASGSSTSKINIGPTTGASAPAIVVPGTVASANQTGQTANISAMTLITPSANTLCRISA